MSPWRENWAQIYAQRCAKWDLGYHGCSDIIRKVENIPRTRIFFYNCWQRHWRVAKCRSVYNPLDENLNAFEDFIGFYQLENIKSDTIVQVIKDILMRINLNLSNCRGQTYDGALNMMGKKSGVSIQILLKQPEAVAIHCQGHSLSLSVKKMSKMTKECDILHDVMSAVGEFS